MADILHRVGIQSSADDVYEALATTEGLRGWWTTNVQGENHIGGVLEFRFDGGGCDVNVVQLDQPKHVLWEVVGGPDEWLGTQLSWELKEEGGQTTVLFKHLGWREPVEFMHHCSTKWAIFLMSLKSLVETGTGAPHPRDVKINN